LNKTKAFFGTIAATTNTRKLKTNLLKGNFMKAVIISSLVFFSLRAMSAEVGEDKKSVCAFANQSKREAKVVVADTSASDKKEEVKSTLSK
jgi:hypothetical protein